MVVPKGGFVRDWNHRLDAYFVSFCRRVFRWSPAYKTTREAAWIKFTDNTKVKWYKCAECKTVWPRPQTRVDHIEPVVPVKGWDGSWDSMKKRMSFDRPENLQVLCLVCHQKKTNSENKERREWRKKKNVLPPE